jgi:hypothetical protein
VPFTLYLLPCFDYRNTCAGAVRLSMDFVATENNKEQAGKNGASDRANENQIILAEPPTGQMKLHS